MKILSITLLLMLTVATVRANVDVPGNKEDKSVNTDVAQQKQVLVGADKQEMHSANSEVLNGYTQLNIFEEDKITLPDSNKEVEEENKYILTKNNNLDVTFSGRIHRMLLNVDDGVNSDMFFTDSEQGPTMLRFDAVGKTNGVFNLGATIETGFRQNRPIQVSQDNREAGTSVNVRIAEIVLSSNQVGKISFGRGFAAAWMAAEMDLSATQFASLLPVGMLAPGMKFVNADSDSLSNIKVLNYFVDLERLLLVDRFRYDSPVFGPGMQVSGSLANDGRWDLALRVKPQSLEKWKLVAGAAYLNKPYAGIDRRLDGGVSVLHHQTGVNLTLGGSIDSYPGRSNTKNWLIKAGWQTNLFEIGKTAFSLDYYNMKDIRIEGDDANSFGFFAVQNWADYGFQFYAGYRKYGVTRPDLNLKDMDVVAVGAVFAF